MAKKKVEEVKKAPAKEKPVVKEAPKKAPVFICQLCGKEFKTTTTLNEHKCKRLEVGFKVEFKQTAYFKKIIDTISKWVEFIYI